MENIAFFYLPFNENKLSQAMPSVSPLPGPSIIEASTPGTTIIDGSGALPQGRQEVAASREEDEAMLPSYPTMYL